MPKPLEWAVWKSIKSRCLANPTTANPVYRERGIVMYERWRESFWEFYVDMGVRPSPDHVLKRIDTNGNFEPGNVSWEGVQKKNPSIYQFCWECLMRMDRGLREGVRPICDRLFEDRCGEIPRGCLHPDPAWNGQVLCALHHRQVTIEMEQANATVV